MGCRFLEPDIHNSGGNHHHHNSKADDNSPWLPPGFRFHPTDEELVAYYLTNKVMNGSFPVQAITEVDLNKCEPWDLPAKAKMGEKEWYFFSLRDRKYPTGMRTNRATEAGYWKATGKDREVTTVRTQKLVGMKKTLVFYRGRAPKGEKTNWIMHEYRIEGEPVPLIQAKPSKDEWVVCRIFQKSAGGGNPKKMPMDVCNINTSNGHHGGGGGSASFSTDGRSSLPALLESPNPNTSVDDSDGCLIESSFHDATGVQDVIKSNNSPWCGLKTEMGPTLDELHHGKGSVGGGSSGSVVLPSSSYLMDLFAAGACADNVMGISATTPTSSSGLRIDNAGYPNLLRQNNNSGTTSFNTLSHSHALMSLKYLENQSSSRGMNNLRACKAEPYAGEDDEAQSNVSHRPSLMDSSWVGGADSAGVHGFGGEASLRSMTNVTGAGMADLDSGNNNNHNTFYPGRFISRGLGSGTFIPDPSSVSNSAVAAAVAAGGELAECLTWAY